MTGEEARQRFLDWLARERRASPLTVEAYGADLADFLGFLVRHLGAEPDATALATLRTADFRAWRAARHAAGLAAPTRARRLAALRSFYRFLARRQGIDIQDRGSDCGMCDSRRSAEGPTKPADVARHRAQPHDGTAKLRILRLHGWTCVEV